MSRYAYVVKPSRDGTYCVECDSFTYDTDRHDAWHESVISRGSGEQLAQALKPMFDLAEQVTRETPAAAKRAGEAMSVLLEQRKH